MMAADDIKDAKEQPLSGRESSSPATAELWKSISPTTYGTTAIMRTKTG